MTCLEKERKKTEKGLISSKNHLLFDSHEPKTLTMNPFLAHLPATLPQTQSDRRLKLMGFKNQFPVSLHPIKPIRTNGSNTRALPTNFL